MIQEKAMTADEYNAIIAFILKKTRQYTQTRLAAGIGRSRSLLARVVNESGSHRPRPETLRAIVAEIRQWEDNKEWDRCLDTVTQSLSRKR